MSGSSLSGRCLYSFAARQHDELSVRKDEVVQILVGPDTDEDWWIVSNGSRSGLVPSSYLKVLPLIEMRSPGTKIDSVEVTAHQVDMSIEEFDDAAWGSAVDPASGDVYYYNKHTGKSQWEVPNRFLQMSVLPDSEEREEERTRTAIVDEKKDAEVFPEEADTEFLQQQQDEVSENDEERISESSQIESDDNDTLAMLKQLRENAQSKVENIRLSMLDNHSAQPQVPAADVKDRVLDTNEVQQVINLATNGEIIQGHELERGSRTSKRRSSKPLMAELEEPVSARFELPPIDHKTPRSSHTESPRENVSMLSPPVKLPVISLSANKSKPSAIPKRAKAAGLLVDPTTTIALSQHCRSKLYAPTSFDKSKLDDMAINDPELNLSMVHGYAGDHPRFTGFGSSASRSPVGCSGRNVFWLNDSVILYPVGAIIVLMAAVASKRVAALSQHYFTSHTEEVSAIAVHPDRRIVASAESGKSGRILVWNTTPILRIMSGRGDDSEVTMLDTSLDSNYKGIGSLSFSGDGKLLSVVTSDESHTLFIYNWTISSNDRIVPIVSLKMGQADVQQFAFNQVLYVPFQEQSQVAGSPDKLGTPMKSKSECNENKAGNRNAVSPDFSSRRGAELCESIPGCYTMYSCVNRSIKFWTLHKYKALADPGVVEVSGFRGRRISMPKRLQQWNSKYHLSGSVSPLPKGLHGGSNVEITCFCVIRDIIPAENGRDSLPCARVFSGTSTGSIIVWQHAEAAAEDDINMLLNAGSRAKRAHRLINPSQSTSLYWLPKGQFLYVVTDVHDGQINDIDVWLSNFQGNKSHDSEQHASSVANTSNFITTCGRDNIVNVWGVVGVKNVQGRKHVPIEHIKAVPLAFNYDVDTKEDVPIPSSIEGICRTVTMSSNGDHIIFGTTGNALCKISGLRNLLQHPSSVEEEEGVNATTLDVLTRGHTGAIRRVACHPTRDVCATVGTDKSLRIWSASLKRQIAMAYIKDDLLTSICFSPHGDILVAGTATFGNILIFRLDFSSKESIEALSLSLIHRKKVVATKTSKIEKATAISKQPGKKESKMPGLQAAAKEPSEPVNQNARGGKNIELTDVCFSPDGSVLAVACKNGHIYLLSIQYDEQIYKRYGVCKGRNCPVLRINFSTDGAIIQANDTGLELSYWNTDTGLQITDTRHLRDVVWSSWGSTCGWPVQGIHNNSDGSDGPHELTNAVSRSKDGSLLVVGSENSSSGSVKLCPYPALPDCKPKVYKAHSSGTSDVGFLASDLSVVTCGGPGDSSVMFWTLNK